VRATAVAGLRRDGGGGLSRARLPSGDDAGADTLRAELARVGGHATLIRAPEQVRQAVPVFQPTAARVTDLSASIRRTFDPDGILNPGRMAA